MIEYDWLTSYQDPHVVERVLQRLEQRLEHKLPLAAGFSELELWREELEGDFVGFMAEALQIATVWKQLN